MGCGGVIEGVLGGVAVGDVHPVRVMLAINLSPESFYKGSIVLEDPVSRVLEFEGFIDFVDVGAMSTAPYLDAWIPVEKELERVRGVLPDIVRGVRIPVSIDTFRPQVAEYALKVGASIVNDVTGGKLYPEMCRVVAEYDASVILMAREREARRGVDPVRRVVDAVIESVEHFERCGVDPRKIAVDPGIGFPILPPGDKPYVVRGEFRHGDEQWPWWKWDLHIIANLDKLRELGKPIVVGVSRKSFLWRITGVNNPEEVLPASLAVEAITVLNGAHVIRTHNPKESWQAIRVAERLRSLPH
jgi:dihydropteroate synthase